MFPRLLSSHVPAWVVLAASSAMGCMDPGASHDVLGEAILDGERSPEGPEDAVLLLQVVGTEAKPMCTATLVASNLVLTARHCVAPVTQGMFLCDSDGELVQDGTYGGRFEPEYAASAIALYGAPETRGAPLAYASAIVSLRPQHICVNDIAFLVLDRHLALPVLPIRKEPSVLAGDAVTLVGYGLQGGDDIDLETQERHRRRDLLVDRVGFDARGDTPGPSAPRTFVVKGAFACRGDSGGPAIAQTDGALVGVYSSLLGTDCRDLRAENFFMHVPPFVPLAEEAFRRAGARPNFSEPEPVPEPEPEPEPVPEPEPTPEPAPDPEGRAVDATEPGGCTISRQTSSRSALWGMLLAALAVARRVQRRSSKGSATTRGRALEEGEAAATAGRSLRSRARAG